MKTVHYQYTSQYIRRKLPERLEKPPPFTNSNSPFRSALRPSFSTTHLDLPPITAHLQTYHLSSTGHRRSKSSFRSLNSLHTGSRINALFHFIPYHAKELCGNCYKNHQLSQKLFRINAKKPKASYGPSLLERIDEEA